MTKIKTKRLLIMPLSDNELEIKINNETDEHMKNALGQMLEMCKQHPKQRLWYTNWEIKLKNENQVIGSLAFLNAPKDGEVEIGYGIDEKYRKCGYASEAVKAATCWALTDSDVFYVTAETRNDNTASIHILEKLGFRAFAAGIEGTIYELEKKAVSNIGTFLPIYMGCGIAFGVIYKNIALTICIGVALGLGLGVCLDYNDKKRREEIKKIRGEKYHGQLISEK